VDETRAHFSHRSCYVNFGEHLQNSWNVNMFYPGAPNRWTLDDWRRWLAMMKAFGFNVFEFWAPPTLFDQQSLAGGGIYGEFAGTMRSIIDVAHSVGIKTKFLASVNCFSPAWYHACPNVAEDKRLICDLWRHWTRELAGSDIVTIFPGDVGGCNRNGCTHETFVDLSLELTDIIKTESPSACVEIGTWGAPFSGWGSDMRYVPDWDGTFAMITDPKFNTADSPCYIWNGGPSRARAAVDYLIRKLPSFPEDTMVAINLGFSPDGDATVGGDARGYAREIAKLRRITTWDYSLCEGELVMYPHWRLPRISARRREERASAPYIGGMCYTMTPKLNLLTYYAAGRFFIDPDADPDEVSREFCIRVFGEEHAALGELFEAFEVVKGWGHYPRRRWSKDVLIQKYTEIVDRLEAADVSGCMLPLFPDPETYRQDLLWFARIFLEMASSNPDRGRIRQDYWRKGLAIYDFIPMSVDARAEACADQFTQILS